MKPRPLHTLWSCIAHFAEAALAATPDVGALRKTFVEATGHDFELVKDILDERPAARGGETYWLAHVKPRRSGRYSLKYTYRYTHGLSHPEEGETEVFIGVGESGGRRGNSSNLGLANVLLGDTVIVPIRMDRMADHQFSLKSHHASGPAIGQPPSVAENTENLSPSQPAPHPLENHLRCLGTRRDVMPSRAAGSETVTFSAAFQAKSPGRFNLLLSSDASGETEAGGSIPVLILDPGTSITALALNENITSYSDDKRFSAHSGHQFITRLLILQPGDIFTLDYASQTHRWEIGEPPPSDMDNPTPSFSIKRLPFSVDRDISFNAWLADHLPPEKTEGP